MEVLSALSQALTMGSDGAMIIVAFVLLKHDKRLFHLELINGIKS